MNIGQASVQSGVSQRMIRHYEAIGLIPQSGEARLAAIATMMNGTFTRCVSFDAHAILGFPIEEIGETPGASGAIATRASGET